MKKMIKLNLESFCPVIRGRMTDNDLIYWMSKNFTRYFEIDAKRTHHVQNVIHGLPEYDEDNPYVTVNEETLQHKDPKFEILWMPLGGVGGYLNTINQRQYLYNSSSRGGGRETVTPDVTQIGMPIRVSHKEVKEDGEIIISQFSKEIIDSFGEPLDLTSPEMSELIATSTNMYTVDAIDAYGGRAHTNGGVVPTSQRGIALFPTFKSQWLIAQRESPYSRVRRFDGWKNTEFSMDAVGSFSALGKSEELKEAVLAMGNDKRSVIQINALFRGGNGQASYEHSENRMQKILKGFSLFSFKARFMILNQETYEWVPVSMICIGMFEAMAKLLKYKRSRAYIPELAQSMHTGGGERFLDPEGYARKILERFGEHVTYWDGIKDIWGEDLPANAIVIDKKEEVTGRIILPKDLTALRRSESISTAPEYMEYTKISKAKADLTQKITTSNERISTLQRSLDAEKRYLVEYEETIKRCKEKIQSYTEEAAKKHKEVVGFVPAREALTKAHEEVKAKWDTYLSELDDEDANPADDTFLSNLENSGIIIEDIFYNNPETGSPISLKEKPGLAWQAKMNLLEDQNFKKRTNNAWLHSIVFRTTKPVIINVDAGKNGFENCKKIVGGPYRVTVNKSPSISIKLLSTNSCFGMNEDKSAFWIHPHTPQQSLYAYRRANRRVEDKKRWKYFTDCLLNASGNACLGEASPPLFAAFTQQNPKRVLFAAMTWISNANSTDAWGKNYKFFPKISDVRIEGTPLEEKTEETVEDLITTEEGMETLAEQMLQNIEEEPATPQETPLVSETVLAEAVERVAEEWRELPDQALDPTVDTADPTQTAMYVERLEEPATNLDELPEEEQQQIRDNLAVLGRAIMAEAAEEEAEDAAAARGEEGRIVSYTEDSENTVEVPNPLVGEIQERMDEFLRDYNERTLARGDTPEAREAADFDPNCECESCAEYREAHDIPPCDPDEHPRETNRLRHAGWEGYQPYRQPTP